MSDLIAFLPKAVLECLSRGPRSSHDGKESLSGAFLFMDIGGLDRLSETLPHGEADCSAVELQLAEQQRAKVLNNLAAAFSRLVSTVHAHGGDVVKFTGSCMVAVWRFTPRTGPERHASAPSATISASRCALELQRTLNGLSLTEAGIDGSGGPSGGDGEAAKATLERQDREECEAAVQKADMTRERLRDICRQARGCPMLNQGGLLWVPDGADSKVLDACGAQLVKGVPARPRHRLALAAGVGVGDLYLLHVGAPTTRWEAIVWGEPLAETARNVHRYARPGDTLASQDVLTLCSDSLRLSYETTRRTMPSSVLLLRAVDASAAGIDVAASHAALRALRQQVAPLADINNDGKLDYAEFCAFVRERELGEISEAELRARFDALDADFSGSIDMHEYIAPYLPPLERALVQAEGVARARSYRAAADVVMLAVRFPSTQLVSAADVIATQQAVALVQQVVLEKQGAFRHFVQTGEGGFALCAFGLPPEPPSSAVAARRAVAAALALSARLSNEGHRQCTIGLSSGLVCLGCLSSDESLETVTIGLPVALSMQLALAADAGRSPILADPTVYQACKTTYNFVGRRAVLHLGGSGGGTPAAAPARLLMVFALDVSKPRAVVVEKKVVNTHAVAAWLRRRAYQLPGQQLAGDTIVAELRECFEGIDTQGTGVISLAQLRTAMLETALFADEALSAALFARMDHDRSGRVEWAEFLEALTAFTATGTGGEADEIGSGSLGENISDDL